ncbi:MAG: acetylglutamate kinase [Ruminococcaceae bacterium]|nr:acetylglutamate kinase [Oscillospiraceae bacterium]
MSDNFIPHTPETVKNLSNLEKAYVLARALPYIQKYRGQTVVIKYGGNAMINEELKETVISDIVLLTCVGINIVLVHGGGPEINEMLEKIGKESKFVNGLRYTDAETMEIVQMVLSGKLNKGLVNRIQQIGGKSVGLSGIDGDLLQAVKLSGDGYDYGNVGEIVAVNPEILNANIKNGFIPVVSTVAEGTDGNPVYNINADTAAAKIAVALGASNLILLTDIAGVMRDPKDPSTLIPEIKLEEIEPLIDEGIIKGGMIPKIRCCADALKEGVSSACIIDGRVPHSILLEMLSDEGAGTMFKL